MAALTGSPDADGLRAAAVAEAEALGAMGIAAEIAAHGILLSVCRLVRRRRSRVRTIVAHER